MSDTPEKDVTTCQNCGKAPATVHVRRVSAGDEEEVRLCLTCAQERGLEPDTTSPDIAMDPVALMFKNMQEIAGSGGTCAGCGMTYARFRETGRLGCAQCYETFFEELEPLLRRVHGAVRHVGKVPIRAGEAYEQTARLRRLNEDLERAIGSEDYERAAEIRDLIQELESAGSGKRDT